MKKNVWKLILGFSLLFLFSNFASFKVKATEIDFSNFNTNTNNATLTSVPTSPSSIYMSGVYIPFTGTNIPTSMYYQRAAYKRLYRGYLDRDWTMSVVLGTGSQLAAYSGRLWRDDFPLPTANKNDLPDSNILYSTSSSSVKKVRITITIDAKKTNIIPAIYQYDDGSYRGILTLVDWTDNSQHPKLHNYVCVYEGYVNLGAGPIAKK